MRILSKELKKHIGKTVEVSGWLHKKRLLGGLNFIIIRDRGGLIQILDKSGEQSKKLDELYQGTIISVRGKVVSDKRAPNQVELHDPKIEIVVPINKVSPIEIDKPISHKAENLHSLFDHRVLNIRNIIEKNIFIIQYEIEKSIRQFLDKNEFLAFRSPKILSGASEGGAEVFKLNYFEKEATLAQSAQFYKQILVGAYERVYEIGSTYRAEPSTTTRHMSEFTTIDVEIAFINKMEDLEKLISELINYINDNIWSQCKSELESLGAKKAKLTKDFPKIRLSDLHEEYFKQTKEDLRHEKDPTPAEERWINEYSLKKYNSEAIFVTDFPASEMKFYQMKNPDNTNLVLRADLIYRGLEIITLTIREHRYEKLVEQLIAIGANPHDEAFKYYMQAFEYGLPPHGGFGLGLERLTQKIIGLGNVKEATLFPRDMTRVSP